MGKIPLEYSQRDLLLMHFPYSDFSGTKVRPVIVVSNNQFNSSSKDLLVCCITSNIGKEQYTVLLDENSLEEGKLLELCCVKTENIAKIDKIKIIKKIGKVTSPIFNDITEKIIKIIHSS